MSRPLTAYLTLALLLVPPSAQAAESQGGKLRQHLNYAVYAGGIHVVEAGLNITTTSDRYTMTFDARTQGFLGALVPWSGHYDSRGWNGKGGHWTPEIHKASSIWQGDEETKTYRYAKSGKFVSLTIQDEKHDGKTPEETDDALTQGTTDLLAATLNVLTALGRGGKCEGREEIFDGKRRFALIFKHEGEDVLPRSDYSAFSGPATRCRVEVKPVAGAWHKKPRGWLSIQEQGRQRGMMPTVWMAKLAKDGPAVPVRVRVKTAYGTLFMHMTARQ